MEFFPTLFVMVVAALVFCFISMFISLITAYTHNFKTHSTLSVVGLVLAIYEPFITLFLMGAFSLAYLHTVTKYDTFSSGMRFYFSITLGPGFLCANLTSLTRSIVVCIVYAVIIVIGIISSWKYESYK